MPRLAGETKVRSCSSALERFQCIAVWQVCINRLDYGHCSGTPIRPLRYTLSHFYISKTSQLAHDLLHLFPARHLCNQQVQNVLLHEILRSSQQATSRLILLAVILLLILLIWIIARSSPSSSQPSSHSQESSTAVLVTAEFSAGQQSQGIARIHRMVWIGEPARKLSGICRTRHSQLGIDSVFACE